MIDHVSIEVRDLAASAAFYDAVLAPLGMTRQANEPATVGWGKRYPEFWINLRAGMAPLAADSGAHVCLRARGTDAVDAFHAAALAQRADDDGGPALRPEYSDNYYAAFIRDPDGNRVEVVTFVEPG